MPLREVSGGEQKNLGHIREAQGYAITEGTKGGCLFRTN